MKVFKGVVILVVLLFFLVLIGVNFLQNSNPYTFLGARYVENTFGPIKWFSLNNLLDVSTYGFSKPSSKEALIIDFSDNDIIYNDSIINLMTKTAEYIDDDLKKWKKTHIIYKKKRYQVKYKFHGSHNYIYKQGRVSLKIKAKENINSAKEFSLITGYTEGNFINIFLALQEHKLKLIAPDPGSILIANLNGQLEDVWFTEDLTNNYLKDKYGFEDFNIFEVSDNWNRNGGPHYSELDGFYYYLDSENIETDYLKNSKYKNFIKSISDIEKSDEFPNTDYQYMGRFLANLYFYFDAHHIQGDNNKYLYDYSNDIVYPVARNEGKYSQITNVLNLDQEIFDKRESPTTIFYKKAVCNDSIKFYRDIELYKLVNNKDKILHQLDSLHTSYNDYHRYYNTAYMNVRYEYKRIKAVINNNSNTINKYLNNGEVIIAFNKKNKTINIATDYRVPLKVIDIENLEHFILNGFDLRYEDNIIKSALIEQKFTFKNVIDKNQLKILNMVTKDTIPSSNIIFNYF